MAVLSRQLHRVIGRCLISGMILTVSIAATAHATDSLSVDQLIELARRNSPELQSADAGLQAARQSKNTATAHRLPQLSAVGNAGYAPFSHSFGYDPAVSNGGELGARLVAEQTLYSGGRVGLQVQQAQTDIAAAAVNRQQSDRDLVYNVQQACIGLLLALRERDLQFEAMTQLTEYAGLARRLNEVGSAAYTDLLNARVQVQKSRVDSSSAELQVRLASQNLNRIAGLPDTTEVSVIGSLENLLVDSNDSSHTALRPDSSNLDLESARLAAHREEVNLSLARSEWKPTVTLIADAGVQTSRENLTLPSGDRYNSVGYSVGMSINIPLWSGGARKDRVAKSRFELAAARHHIDAVKRDVFSAWREINARLADAYNRLSSIRAMVKTARDNYLLSYARYADGDIPASEVLIAHQSLIDARRMELQALAQLQTTKADSERLAQSKQDVSP